MRSIIELIGLVAYIAIFWMFFTKANKPGWLALVPVYGLIVMGKLVKKPISGIIAGVASLAVIYVIIAALLVFTGSIKGITGGASAVLGLGIIIFYIAFLLMLVGMTKAFDKKGGYWVLFVLLPYIAVFMTNSAHYKGDASVTPTVPTSQPPNPTTQSNLPPDQGQYPPSQPPSPPTPNPTPPSVGTPPQS